MIREVITFKVDLVFRSDNPKKAQELFQDKSASIMAEIFRNNPEVEAVTYTHGRQYKEGSGEAETSRSAGVKSFCQ